MLQHRAVLAAHEIDATAVRRRARRRRDRCAVAVLVAGQRQVPAEVLVSVCRRASRAPSPVLGERATTTPRTCAVDARVRRRDDHVREPVAREVRHRHHPVTEEPVRQTRRPTRGSARRSRPTRPSALPFWSVALRSLKRAPAAMSARPSPSTSSGSPKRKPSSPFGTSPANAPRHAPAGAGSRSRAAPRRRARGSRRAGSRAAANRRQSASPARACRRRRVHHMQQPTQLGRRSCTAGSDWSAPRAPVPLLSAHLCRATGVRRPVLPVEEPPRRRPGTAGSGGCASSIAQKDGDGVAAGVLQADEVARRLGDLQLRVRARMRAGEVRVARGVGAREPERQVVVEAAGGGRSAPCSSTPPDGIVERRGRRGERSSRWWSSCRSRTAARSS